MGPLDSHGTTRFPQHAGRSGQLGMACAVESQNLRDRDNCLRLAHQICDNTIRFAISCGQDFDRRRFVLSCQCRRDQLSTDHAGLVRRRVDKILAASRNCTSSTDYARKRIIFLQFKRRCSESLT